MKEFVIRWRRFRALVKFGDARIGLLGLALASALFAITPIFATVATPHWVDAASYLGVSALPWVLVSLTFAAHALLCIYSATCERMRWARTAATIATTLWVYALVAIPGYILIANGYVAPSAWAMYSTALGMSYWTLRALPLPEDDLPPDAPSASVRRSVAALTLSPLIAASTLAQPYGEASGGGGFEYGSEIVVAIVTGGLTLLTTILANRAQKSTTIMTATADQADHVMRWTRENMERQDDRITALETRNEGLHSELLGVRKRLLSLERWAISQGVDLAPWHALNPPEASGGLPSIRAPFGAPDPPAA